MKAYADLYDLPEDERIDVIGAIATQGDRVGFVVENKRIAERYVRKLQIKFKAIRIIETGPGPVPNTVMVQIGPLPN